MQDYVHSGYYGIFRPPYSLVNKSRRSSIYCVSDRLNTILILIPLVSSFYIDAIDIIKKSSSRNVYLIAPDIGIGFVSDYYQTWFTVTKTLRKKCQIFSKYMPENFTRADFKADVIRTKNDSISFDVPRSDIDVGTISITITKQFVNSASPYSCDIILDDTYKKRLFCGEMNTHKATYINQNRSAYDEIHMPYLTGNYGDMSYDELVRKFPFVASKTFCHSFVSLEEYEYARERIVSIGEAFNSDFI